MYIIFAAIGNFYYVGIYHSVDLYQYIARYSIAIVNYDYRHKIKNRKKTWVHGRGLRPLQLLLPLPMTRRAQRVNNELVKVLDLLFFVYFI